MEAEFRFGRADCADPYGRARLVQYSERPTGGAPPSISFSEPAVINPYPELEGVHININRATVEELQQLPGIGETKAQAIYDYVQACGGIKSFRQLLDVEGIGEKTLRNIQPYLTISPPG